MKGGGGMPALAPIPRRAKPDRGARGRAAPKRVLTTVKVRVFDPVACEIVTETTQAYICELSPLLAAAPEPLRKAAQAYAKAVEEVEAGGVSDPAAGSGGGMRDGRQFHALRLVTHLRGIESAVGGAAINLGCRCDDSPVVITYLVILRAVAVDGLTVTGLLKGLRLGRSISRRRAVIAGLLVALEAVAVHLGLIVKIKKQPKDEKTA